MKRFTSITCYSILSFLLCSCVNPNTNKSTYNNENEEYRTEIETIDHSFYNKADDEDENTIVEETLPTSSYQNINIDPEKLLGRYESGDNNAMQGDPEVLSLYKAEEDDEYYFTFHAIWNTQDICGKATWAGTRDSYIYINNNYRFYIIFNEEDEKEVTVREFLNGDMTSEINLWK